MKSQIVIVIAALTLFAGADKPRSSSAVKTQRAYEDVVRAADNEFRQSLKTAQDEYLKQLKEASDAALEAKDLNAANEIDAALKAIVKKKPFVAPTFQSAIDAQRIHEDAVLAANEKQLAALKAAEEVYLQEMQVGLDAAIAAKDLAEANRIDAAMKEIQQKIDTRNATGKPVFSTTTNSIGMMLVVIPAGEFTMGSPLSEAGREQSETEHRVILTEPFEMGAYEVTQAQYESVMGSNPSKFKGANNPVEMVSWDDAVAFCAKVSELPAEQAAGRKYRLPTEAEWEYACRAGTSTAYSFGGDEKKLGKYAWFGDNSGAAIIDSDSLFAFGSRRLAASLRANKCQAHAVGAKLPNSRGLYDMHGNVWEWCSDTEGSNRVLRGGGWDNVARGCRSANRSPFDPTRGTDNVGFRVALSLAGQ